MGSAGEFSSLISDVLMMFESVSGLIFKLKKEHDTAVKNLLSNQNVLAILLTAYGDGEEVQRTAVIALSNIKLPV